LTIEDFRFSFKPHLFQAETLRSAVKKIRSGESEREFELEMERKKMEIEKLESNKQEMEAQVND